jgi:CBS domain-containing protein
MRVSDVMSREVTTARSSETLREVADRMAAGDLGFLPVVDDEGLIGTVTDRDLVVRGLAKGLDGTAQLRAVMTDGVLYCFEDEDLEHVVQNMGDIQVRRLPVVDREKRLVGIVSLADAVQDDPETVGIAMSGITNPPDDVPDEGGSVR